ncbi:TolB family protein [Ponticaulis profundi]|uniref:TolB family protein n=1 Tax=Ponticaulis profundi TaxID=2665222 RepID=A0ABW1S9J8_9PROT
MRAPRLWITLLTAALLGSCAASQKEPPQRRSEQADWTNKRNVHKDHPRYAISGDGKWVAFTTQGRPQNSLTILNVETGEFYDLQSEDPDTVLFDADLSDDGARLAVVRGRRDEYSSHVVESDIVITDLQGKILDSVPSCNDLYSSPSFSPDGERIAYYQFANNGIRSDRIENRGSTLLTPDLAMEFDLVSRSERQLVDLAWLSTGWIDYTGSGDVFALRAGEVARRKPETAPGFARPVLWGYLGGESVLDQFSEEKRGTLYLPALYLLNPDAERPEDQITGSFDRNGDWVFRGAARSGYLVQYNNPRRTQSGLWLVPEDFLAAHPDDVDVESGNVPPDWPFISSSGDFVHAAAISYNGCFVVDARKQRVLRDVTIHVWNICSGELLQTVEEPKTIARTVVMEGGYRDEC